MKSFFQLSTKMDLKELLGYFYLNTYRYLHVNNNNERESFKLNKYFNNV